MVNKLLLSCQGMQFHTFVDREWDFMDLAVRTDESDPRVLFTLLDIRNCAVDRRAVLFLHFYISDL